MQWETDVHCLICPRCQSAFTARDGALRCASGHSFDIAKESYVNLLATQGAAPLVGDSREMLRARRAFLDRGHYQPLAAAISVCVAARLDASATVPGPLGAILDVGCGEGYYLGQLQAHLQRWTGPAISYHCMDIARDAVRLAAKRYPALHAVVADAHRPLPYATGAFAALLNIFAPRHPEEFRRVLAPGGLLLVVIPTADHLAGLRERVHLLSMEPDKRQRVEERFASGFSLARVTPLDYTLDLDGAQARDLAQMTPSARHMAPETVNTLDPHERIATRISVELLEFVAQ